jgi:hypothetical protein
MYLGKRGTCVKFVFAEAKMFDRLLDKKEKPTMEAFLAYIGQGKESFEIIDSFLLNELNALNDLKFDAHSRCWKLRYGIKKEYVCDIIAEKDAFTVVTRLAEGNIQRIYNVISTSSSSY